MLASNLLLSLWACDPKAGATIRICRAVAASPGAEPTDSAAKQLARAAIKVHRQDEQVLLAVARMCIAIGDLPLAEEALRWAWACSWDDPRIVQMYGEICLHRQDPEAAREAFEYMAALRRQANERGDRSPSERPSGVYVRPVASAKLSRARVVDVKPPGAAP